MTTEWSDYCRQQTERSLKGLLTGLGGLMSPATAGDGLWWVHRQDGSGDFTIEGSANFDFKEAAIAACEIDDTLALTLGD